MKNLQFPLEFDGRGGLKLIGDEHLIEQAVRQAVLICKGELLLRPSFGLDTSRILSTKAYTVLGQVKKSLEDVSKYYLLKVVFETTLDITEDGYYIEIKYDDNLVRERVA